MEQRAWVRRGLRILRHDLTLACLAVALAAVSVGVLAAGHGAADPPGAEAAAPPAPATETARAEAPPAPPPVPEVVPAAPAPPALKVAEGEIRRGDTVAAVLREAGASHRVIHTIDRTMRPSFDFRRARPGHRYQLVHTPDGELVEFRYHISSIESFVVRRRDGAWTVGRDDVELRPEVTRIAGVVATSVHDAVVGLGERPQLAHDFSEIFAWDIDFSRTVQAGDEFQILYERLYRDDLDEGPVYVRPGRILSARYQGAAGDFGAFYFEVEEGRGGYYRPDGTSVQREFLLAPLRYSRITSRYTSARRHPILKVTRPHHGIDYAAPRGTPVWSVANGVVIYRGWAGGFGNLVKVRHDDDLVSYYAHLERFPPGLSVGDTVQQKQVIGYVGSTGLATGPHVCFRIARNGSYVDPTRLYTPAGPPVPQELKPLFFGARDLLLAQLDSGPLVSVEEAL